MCMCVILQVQGLSCVKACNEVMHQMSRRLPCCSHNQHRSQVICHCVTSQCVPLLLAAACLQHQMGGVMLPSHTTHSPGTRRHSAHHMSSPQMLLCSDVTAHGGHLRHHTAQGPGVTLYSTLAPLKQATAVIRQASCLQSVMTESTVRVHVLSLAE